MNKATCLFLLFSILFSVSFSTCEDRTWDNIFDANSDVDPENWAPHNLTARAFSFSMVRLTWQPTSTRQGIWYHIERKPTEGEYKKIASTADTTYIDTLRERTIPYLYRLRASAGENVSAPSNAQEINLGEWSFPKIRVSEDSLNLGAVVFGDSLDWNFRITNMGDSTLVVKSMIIRQEVFTISTPELPQEIAPDDSLSCTIRFSPPEVMSYTDREVYADTLIIMNNDPARPNRSVPLMGCGFFGGKVMHTLGGTVLGVNVKGATIKFLTTITRISNVYYPLYGIPLRSAIVTNDTELILVDYTNPDPTTGEPAKTPIELSDIEIDQIIRVTSEENIKAASQFYVKKVEIIKT